MWRWTTLSAATSQSTPRPWTTRCSTRAQTHCRGGGAEAREQPSAGDAGYKGECYPQLAPKKDFWKKWHANIEIISEEENNKYYVQEYWNQVLSKLDPEKVFRDLNNSVLLCYEDNMLFCHRHIVAAWLELTLGVKVPEAKATDYKIEVIERPEYIKKYLLEEIQGTL